VRRSALSGARGSVRRVVLLEAQKYHSPFESLPENRLGAVAIED
jgi:hypothetical protein